MTEGRAYTTLSNVQFPGPPPFVPRTPNATYSTFSSQPAYQYYEQKQQVCPSWGTTCQEAYQYSRNYHSPPAAAEFASHPQYPGATKVNYPYDPAQAGILPNPIQPTPPVYFNHPATISDQHPEVGASLQQPYPYSTGVQYAPTETSTEVGEKPPSLLSLHLPSRFHRRTPDANTPPPTPPAYIYD